MSEEIQNKTSEEPIKPMVLDYNDVCKMAPFFKGKEKLVNKIFHWISVDKTNDFHQRNMHLSGPDFCHNIFDYVGATLTVRNEHVLENLPEGAEIHWFVNGEDVGTGESYTVEDPTEDYNIYAAAVDADGNTLDETQVQAVKVRNGFMDKLKWFFSDFWNNIFKAVIDAIIKAC